jgi:hypothetical protein
MSFTAVDPFALSEADIRSVLRLDAPLIPELEAVRDQVASLRAQPAMKIVLAQTEPLMDSVSEVPQTRYTEYRLFVRTGDRDRYEEHYFCKRAKLTAASLRLFLGNMELKAVVQDLIWSICEESDWVVPAHEGRPAIDLYAAETAHHLAEVLLLVGDTLDWEVRNRVRTEIERRIFSPYLRAYKSHDWYQRPQNWNSVCNSAIAATFLILEPDPDRLAHALEVALAGLRVYVTSGFEQDGASTEGVHCWRYGLTNFIAMAEMLRAKTTGAIDLLGMARMRDIAAYPDKMRLSDARYASFPDSEENIEFDPGIIQRLADRTGEPSLRNLLTPAARPGQRHTGGRDGIWRLPMALRNLVWWDGSTYPASAVEDAILPYGGVARLVATTNNQVPIVLIAKAGHNQENHNHNDVSSFVLHVEGETMLTDPGRGLFTRQYFHGHRYENIFANSYGHSVPRIGGRLQGYGREFRGELLGLDTEDDSSSAKRIAIEFAAAYPTPGLGSLQREFRLGHGGTIWLTDRFRFGQSPEEVEEALVTWLDVTVDGATAILRGQRHSLRLTIEEPSEASFEAERLEQQSRENAKPRVLMRLWFRLQVAATTQARVRMEVVPVQSLFPASPDSRHSSLVAE